jgi:hypothetical protein
MSNAPSAPPPPDRGHPPAKSSPRERISLAIQLTLSLGLAGAVLAYLIWQAGKPPSAGDDSRAAKPEQVVRLVEARTIEVTQDTALAKKLQVAVVQARPLRAPVLPVTGTLLASLRPDKEKNRDSWQFATPDLLSTFHDWQKAVVDVQFQETQLAAIRDLNQSRISAQTKVVARMEKLVKAGTDTEKDLAVERTNLILARIQGRKEIHEGENALKLARRTEATLARQLQQAGLEPTMLRSAAAQGEIVVAEVPERAIGRVRLGMTCEVRFFAVPNRVFTGRVSSISPVISKDKRVLNVQFIVKDEKGVLRPGMFAEIGLGTDPRRALLMPADGVLHVGDRDYALLAGGPGRWQIREVDVGELRGSEVEVLSGLEAGNRVLGQGAILLKPLVVSALQAPSSDRVTALGDRNP